ncbi:hypothetical protein [Beduini massiliensis]|uniref:hypothetical protein n=1 Tax=Beduini massiliensis TaxID=1585974 RepID=UPI00059AB49C|nr:hypothetical protein [Beduini massiliensis]
MKKLLFQKIVLRLGFVFILCLVWYLIQHSSLTYILTYPVFICGILFFAIAWFSYLNLDGMQINRFSFSRQANQMVNKIGNDHIEQTTSIPSSKSEVIAFYSDIIVGIILILPSIILSLL